MKFVMKSENTYVCGVEVRYEKNKNLGRGLKASDDIKETFGKIKANIEEGISKIKGQSNKDNSIRNLNGIEDLEENFEDNYKKISGKENKENSIRNLNVDDDIKVKFNEIKEKI